MAICFQLWVRICAKRKVKVVSMKDALTNPSIHLCFEMFSIGKSKDS